MSDQSAINAVRVWMRDVLRETGWTPAEWARRAMTSPTNITRLLSPTATICPKVETLAKLCRVVGSQPNLAGPFVGDAIGGEDRVNFCPACGFDLKPLRTKPSPRAAAG